MKQIAKEDTKNIIIIPEVVIFVVRKRYQRERERVRERESDT